MYSLTHMINKNTQQKFIMEAQLGKPPTLPITAKLYFKNSFLLLLHTRMVLHPIYQQLMEGGYNPLVLLAATERMLLHPIYQLLLEGGYDPLASLWISLELPYHPLIFYLISISTLCHLSLDFSGLCLLLLLH